MQRNLLRRLVLVRGGFSNVERSAKVSLSSLNKSSSRFFLTNRAPFSSSAANNNSNSNNKEQKKKEEQEEEDPFAYELERKSEPLKQLEAEQEKLYRQLAELRKEQAEIDRLRAESKAEGEEEFSGWRSFGKEFARLSSVAYGVLGASIIFAYILAVGVPALLGKKKQEEEEVGKNNNKSN